MIKGNAGDGEVIVGQKPSRRTFCAVAIGAFLSPQAKPTFFFPAETDLRVPKIDVAAIDRMRIHRAAERYLREAPVTITAFPAVRSAGGKHDYFSEGDYWWPDPANPSGPYIQRDGLSNPDNFTQHRHALLRLSVQVPALSAAWLITRKEHYASRAAGHLRAWFVDESTRMNPNLEFAQAIHGRTTGRGIGIIDTLHLVEVARAAAVLEGSKSLTNDVRDQVRDWFAAYLRWMTTSSHGIEEREAKNNHATSWVLQVAEFSRYTGNADLVNLCRKRFVSVLVPNQIAPNGSFPLELARTKPYAYSLFNLDVMAAICQSVSAHANNLWTFETSDGRSIRKAVDYMFPFIADKNSWPLPPDAQYFDQWPVRQPSLFFAALAFARAEYLKLWLRLNPDPDTEEVIRNFPIRQPLLWV
jgi:alginate lyase